MSSVSRCISSVLESSRAGGCCEGTSCVISVVPSEPKDIAGDVLSLLLPELEGKLCGCRGLVGIGGGLLYTFHLSSILSVSENVGCD